MSVSCRYKYRYWHGYRYSYRTYILILVKERIIYPHQRKQVKHRGLLKIVHQLRGRTITRISLNSICWYAARNYSKVISKIHISDHPISTKKQKLTHNYLNFTSFLKLSGVVVLQLLVVNYLVLTKYPKFLSATACCALIVLHSYHSLCLIVYKWSSITTWRERTNWIRKILLRRHNGFVWKEYTLRSSREESSRDL